MAFTKLTDHIEELSDHLEAYVNSMVAYYKLDFFKKFMKGFSALVKLLIVGSIFLFFLGFLSIAFAILIGKSLGSLSAGFFIIGAFYFIAFVVLLIFWRHLVEGIFLEKFSRFIFNESEFEDKLEESQDIMAEEDSWGRDV